LLFTGAGNHTLSTTGITTNRITFGDIHFSNVNGKNVNVLGDNPKRTGTFTSTPRQHHCFNGTSNALPNGNTFGSVTFADGFSGAQGYFQGKYVFNGAVSIHANGATAFANLINFTGTNAFKGTFTARLNNTTVPELQFASTGANTTAFYGAVSSTRVTRKATPFSTMPLLFIPAQTCPSVARPMPYLRVAETMHSRM
jgi:hypothetical protein